MDKTTTSGVGSSGGAEGLTALWTSLSLFLLQRESVAPVAMLMIHCLTLSEIQAYMSGTSRARSPATLLATPTPVYLAGAHVRSNNQ